MQNLTSFNPLQPSNAENSIQVIPAGRVKLVNSLQPQNAPSHIEVIPAGRVKLVNLLQPWNAKLPITSLEVE